ncbi:hypothetical protein ACHQM5_019738 [Ranunculus cassubicifolius]
MGWVWQNDDDDNTNRASRGSIGDDDQNNSDDRCSTSKVIRSQCHTEEIEPGKFVRKCQKTEEILKSCFGRPTEVVKSNSEYTEEDVTNEMTKGGRPSLPFNSTGEQPFDFPGLRSDMDVIEKNLFGSLNKFLEAAEEMSNDFLGFFGAPSEGPSVSRGSVPFSKRVPVEGPSEGGPSRKQKSEEVALSEFGSQVQDV